MHAVDVQQVDLAGLEMRARLLRPHPQHGAAA
jgi:hypothetical protein